MAILVNAFRLRKAFGARPLFDGLTFSIESGERIGLIGPNGAGKSTLLRILAGQDTPDDGTLSLQRGLKVAFLEQVPTFAPRATIHSAVLEGVEGDWEKASRAEEQFSKLSLGDPETPIDSLSGGWKKRVALARELVREPDLLLLDEPTNHLDVESILWLEELLERARFATLTITHDRVFLQRVSNRIVELDPRNAGGLLSVKGDYAAYLETKEQLMLAQESREIRLKNTLRRETEWLRRGAKARTTKQQARIKRAEDLAKDVGELETRNRSATTRLDFQGAEKNPKKLLEAKRISKSYGDLKVFSGIDLLLTPGTRVGLLGPNGCGKSTLIRVLLGSEPSDSGEVFRSEHLKVAYFEQNRDSLDPSISVLKTLCPTGDHVHFGENRVHIRSYLDRFLFSQAQAEMAVGKLSGGEQSRLLLARLMLQEANLLVLDEPTNDLDMATLNVLEDTLREFEGAVLLVTHDRYFLDQVATRILAFDPFDRGKVLPFADLTQWESWHALREVEVERAQAPAQKEAPARAAPPAVKKKLTYKDQYELDRMEATILAAEEELTEATRESEKPENATNASKMSEIVKRLGVAQAEVDRLYARWAELAGE